MGRLGQQRGCPRGLNQGCLGQFFPPPTGGFSNLLARRWSRLDAHHKNPLEHAWPPTIGIVRSRRDLTIPPLKSFLGEDLAQPPLSFTTTRDPLSKRTWNQSACNFSKVWHGPDRRSLTSNLLEHAGPRTTGIVRSRRDLTISPLKTFLRQDLAHLPFSFTTTRDPVSKRTWNQSACNFSKVWHGPVPRSLASNQTNNQISPRSGQRASQFLPRGISGSRRDLHSLHQR